MPVTSWKTGTNGSWATGSNWTGGAAPNSSTTDAVIDVGGSYTVTLAAGTSFVVNTLSLSAVSATLALAGTLSLAGASATLSQSGGRLTLTGTIAGGGVALSDGTLAVQGGGAITGAFTQTGGTVSIASGKVLTLSGATLNSSAQINGPGTLATTGATTITSFGVIYVDGGLTWTNSGTVTDGGYIDANYPSGIGTTTVNNTATGVFNLTSDTYLLYPYSGTATFSNAGTLAKTGGTGTSNVYAKVTSTGTINAASGTIELDGTNNVLGGVIAGAGALNIAGDTTISSGATVSVGSFGLSNGVLSFAGATQTIGNFVQTGGTVSIASGKVLTLSGATLTTGQINGPGTLATTGATTITSSIYVDGGLTWTNSGTVTDGGYIYANNPSGIGTTTVNNTATGVFNVTSGTDLLYSSSGTATFSNAGTLAKTVGTGTSNVYAKVTSTGTINAASGTIELDGANNVLGGVIAGAGALNVAGDTTISSGATVSVGSLRLSNGVLSFGDATRTVGSFVQTGGTVSIASGKVLTLSGATLTNGQINGPGTLATTGATTITSGGVIYVDGSLTWTNSGTVTDGGYIYANNPSGIGTTTVNNTATGVFNVTSGTDLLYSSSGTATFSNAGTLAKTGGTGTSTVYARVINTGTVLASQGTLELDNGGALNGVLGASAATALLNLAGGFTYTTAGSGTVNNNGAAVSVRVASGNTWSVGGTLTLLGRLNLGTVGSSSVAGLSIGAGGTLQFGADGTLLSRTGNFTITNAGRIDKTGGTGASVVSLNVANSGILAASRGTLQITGIMSGTGTLLANGAVLELASSGVIGTNAVAFGGTSATLKLDTNFSITKPMQGFGGGDRVDLAAATGATASIAGSTLTITPTGGAALSFVSAQSLANVGYAITPDGTGGTVVSLIRAASGTATPSPFVFANAHVGDLVTQALTVSNTALADGYSEQLDATLGPISDGFGGSGSVSLLAAGTSSNGLSLTLGTSTAGALSGTAVVNLFSNGTGIDNRGQTALGTQTIAVTGAVYNYATASLSSSSVNFGIVHVGDVVSTGVGLANLAAAGLFSEGLDGAVAALGGAATGSGTVANLAAGGSNATAFTVGLATSGNGAVSGSVSFSLTSDGTGTSGLGLTALPGQTIAVTGTIANYATADIAKTAGAGTLTGSGTSYTLSFGTLAFGTAAASATLAVLNSATGFADLLSGSFSIANVTGLYANAGFTAFADIAAGGSFGPLTVALNTSAVGVFTETIVLSPTGSNASGYAGALAAETITVTGTIVGGQTYTLTTGIDTITGTAFDDTIKAAAGTLSKGDKIDGAGGTNTLVLQGGGTFNMALPTTLTNVQVVQAQEGAGAAKQTLTLRNGLDVTVNVAAAAAGTVGAGIVINAGSNNSTINLGSGADTVTLGSAGQKVFGGGGKNTFNVTAASIGATISGGGAGTSALVVSGGGTLAMGSNITGIASVTLKPGTGIPAYAFTANALAKLAVTGSGAADTIRLGAASQSVNANGGAVRVLATAAFAGAKVTGAAGAVLELTTGGTAKLNAATSAVTVQLDAATNLNLSKASFVAALGSAGSDTITAGAANQTLGGGLGVDKLVGFSGFGDTFRDTAAGLNGDTIQNFGGTDVIDLTDIAYVPGQAPGYAGTATQGTLTLTDGVKSAQITMLGNFTAANFATASDGAGGLLVSWHA